jgi:uncharacterized membrane protein
MDIEKLKALSELRDKGILTSEEFQTEKNKILYAQSTHVEKQPESDKGNLIVIGYVMSVMPVLILPIVFTIVGVIMGVINMTKGKTGHGSAQIGISVFCGIMGTAIGGAGFGL